MGNELRSSRGLSLVRPSLPMVSTGCTTALKCSYPIIMHLQARPSEDPITPLVDRAVPRENITAAPGTATRNRNAPRMQTRRCVGESASGSRRDEMMVARHKMPGKSPDMIRPAGNGMIRGASPIAPRYQLIIPYPNGTGFLMPRFQAFHAWLPSRSPSGTSMASPSA